MFSSPKALFRVLAIAEMISWTLLIAGLIARAVADAGWATSIAGSIHGFVFLSYGATAVLLTLHQRWPVGVGILAIASAVIPYATLPVERWLARTGRLDGEWLREVPVPARWYDPLMVWFLRRPWVLAVLVVVAVVVLYVVLVSMGSPLDR